jgi:hypothetical protein
MNDLLFELMIRMLRGRAFVERLARGAPSEAARAGCDQAYQIEAPG